MFGRRTSQPTATDDVTVTTEPAGKGRATPSRKEAEAARKATLKTGANPKALARDERARRAKGIQSGDPRYLPRRDQGPARALARDVADERRTVSEFFLYFTFALLLASLSHNAQLLNVLVIMWLVFFVALVADSARIWRRIRRRVRTEFPESTDSGAAFYGVLRSIQIRKLRTPKPRVGPGSPAAKSGSATSQRSK